MFVSFSSSDDGLHELEPGLSRWTRTSSCERRLRRHGGLLEAVMVEPVGVAHLNETFGGVPHEQQLRVAEAVLEVGEERRLAHRHTLYG